MKDGTPANRGDGISTRRGVRIDTRRAGCRICNGRVPSSDAGRGFCLLGHGGEEQWWQCSNERTPCRIHATATTKGPTQVSLLGHTTTQRRVHGCGVRVLGWTGRHDGHKIFKEGLFAAVTPKTRIQKRAAPMQVWHDTHWTPAQNTIFRLHFLQLSLPATSGSQEQPAAPHDPQDDT